MVINFRVFKVDVISSVFAITLSSLAFSSSSSYAALKMKDMDTARTLSTAGAGVGSVLMNEATTLNPASVFFYNNSSVYVQRANISLDEEDSSRAQSPREGENNMVIMTDTSSPLKGGFSYQHQWDHTGKRIRYATSAASHIGKKTAMGVTYRYTEEVSEVKRGFYNQFVLGFTHAQTEQLTLGATIIDPFQNVDEYYRYTVGFQYSFNEFISLIADAGSGDMANPEDEGFTKWSIQLRSFDWLYLRYGQFHDKFDGQKGIAYGFSWIGPRLSLDYGHKIAEKIPGFTDELLTDEKLIETSIGLTVLF